MGAAGRVVHEPRFGRVLGSHPMQPLHGLIRHVVGQVVRLAVLAVRDPDGGLVLGDQRVVLARLAAQQPPEVIEPPRVRPPVERTGRPLHVIRGHMPFSEPAGAVTVALQCPYERCAILRHRRGVAGEGSRQLADGAETDPVMVAAGEHGRPGWRAQRRHVEPVEGQALLGNPGHGWRRHRAAECRGVPESGVIDQHQHHVGCPLRRPGGHVDGPVRHRLVYGATDRPPEVRVGDGQPGAIRVELAHGLGQRRPPAGEARSCRPAPPTAWPPPTMACSIARRYSSSKMAMIPADPAGSAWPSLSCNPVLILCSANLPTMAPPTAPTATDANSSGANRPTTTPTPAPHPSPLRPR